MQVIETKRIGEYLIEVCYDNSPESPREWSNLGKMICFHGRYALGDKHDYNSKDYNGWDEMEAAIIKNEKALVILPLYLYDHSGITIATTPFSCSWDSGQVGWIYATREDIKNEYSVNYVTKKIIANVTEILENEVKSYDHYLTGEVYSYTVYKLTTCSQGDEHKGEIDSCSGFYSISDCLGEAENIVEHYIEQTNKK